MNAEHDDAHLPDDLTPALQRLWQSNMQVSKPPAGFLRDRRSI